MKNDETPPDPGYPVSSAKLSKTPSWIMLGFLLGAAFVVALPPLWKRPAAKSVPVPTLEPVPPAAPRDPPQLTTIEAVFAAEEKYAVWADDITEVALWNSRDGAFSDFYEVRRIGGARYFRTISTLTRRIIDRGKPRPESPLQFTESEEQYREWKEHGRSERPTGRELSPINDPPMRKPPPPSTAPASVVVPPRVAPPPLEPIAPPFGRAPVEKK